MTDYHDQTKPITRDEFNVLMKITALSFPSSGNTEREREQMETIWEIVKNMNLLHAMFFIIEPLFALRVATDQKFSKSFIKHAEDFSKDDRITMLSGNTPEELEREAKKHLEQERKDRGDDNISITTFDDLW